MEEILATATKWLFAGKPSWYMIGWYLLACMGMFLGLFKFYMLAEEFERFEGTRSYWEHDPKAETYVPKNVYSLAPVKSHKHVTNTTTYNYKRIRPKHPPKPIFFGRIDGAEVNIEGPFEEDYLWPYQVQDWKRWEREQALSKVKEKAKNVHSQATSGDKHEQKTLL